MPPLNQPTNPAPSPELPRPNPARSPVAAINPGMPANMGPLPMVVGATPAQPQSFKTPVFVTHLLLQIATWLGYYDSSSHSLKIGTLVLSGTSFLGYLAHLTKHKN